jgi:hypothetical protein
MKKTKDQKSRDTVPVYDKQSSCAKITKITNYKNVIIGSFQR